MAPPPRRLWPAEGAPHLPHAYNSAEDAGVGDAPLSFAAPLSPAYSIVMQGGGGTDAGGSANATPPAAGDGGTAPMSAGSDATAATGGANCLVDDDGIAPVTRANALHGGTDQDDAAWESHFESWTSDSRGVPRPFGFASSPRPSPVAPSQPRTAARQEAVAVAIAMEIDDKMTRFQAALTVLQAAVAVGQAATNKSGLAVEVLEAAVQAAVRYIEKKQVAAAEALAQTAAAHAAIEEAAAALAAVAGAASAGGGSATPPLKAAGGGPAAPPPNPRRRTRQEKNAHAAARFWAKAVRAGKVDALTHAARARVFCHVAAAGAAAVDAKLRLPASPADRAGRPPATVLTNGDVEMANEAELRASTAAGGCNGGVSAAHALLAARSKHFSTKVSRWRKAAMSAALAADLAELAANGRGGGAPGAGPDRGVEDTSGGGGDDSGGGPAMSGAGQGRSAPRGANARAAARPPGPGGAHAAAPADAGCLPANASRSASGRCSPPFEGGGGAASAGATAATGRRTRNGVGHHSSIHN